MRASSLTRPGKRRTPTPDDTPLSPLHAQPQPALPRTLSSSRRRHSRHAIRPHRRMYAAREVQRASSVRMHACCAGHTTRDLTLSARMCILCLPGCKANDPRLDARRLRQRVGRQCGARQASCMPRRVFRIKGWRVAVCPPPHTCVPRPVRVARPQPKTARLRVPSCWLIRVF